MTGAFEVSRAGCPVFAEDLERICRQHRRNGEGLYVMDCPFCNAANGMSVSDSGDEGAVSCAVCGVQFRVRWQDGREERGACAQHRTRDTIRAGRHGTENERQ